MTNRRWMRNEDDQGPGPLESAARAEMERLGWTPLTEPGPLLTAVNRVLLLAETLDRSQNSAALPALDRQFAAAMDDVRRACEPDTSGLRTEAEPEEVSDFALERQKRRPPPPGVTRDQR